MRRRESCVFGLLHAATLWLAKEEGVGGRTHQSRRLGQTDDQVLLLISSLSREESVWACTRSTRVRWVRRFCQACWSWKIMACRLKVNPRIRVETLQWCEGCGQVAKAMLRCLQTDKWRNCVGYYSQKSCLTYICAARFYHYCAALSKKKSFPFIKSFRADWNHSASLTPLPWRRVHARPWKHVH